MLYPIPHPQVAARVIDGEAVIILAESSEVVVLNGVGSRIWELADGRRSLADISRQIALEFEVSAEQAGADVVEFVETLQRERMVELGEAPRQTA